MKLPGKLSGQLFLKFPEELQKPEKERKRLEDIMFIDTNDFYRCIKEDDTNVLVKQLLRFYGGYSKVSGAEKLHTARQEAARRLEHSIAEELKPIKLEKLRFFVDICSLPQEQWSKNGMEQITFLVSTNPGQPPCPLSKITSGGELSRLMLAIKLVIASQSDVSTLIFDEIDTGISGRTAQMVSERLSYIAKKHQVLCITHLPQIAAMADTHFEIKKTVENGRTVTKIHKLSENEQFEELARLLGGAEITEAVRENAREMKRLAMERKVI